MLDEKENTPTSESNTHAPDSESVSTDSPHTESNPLPPNETNYQSSRVYSPAAATDNQIPPPYRPSYTTHSYTAPPAAQPTPPRPKKHLVFSILAFLLAIVFAGTSGFLGAWMFMKNNSSSSEPANSVLYQSVIRTVEADEDLGSALTVKEVAEIASPSVVEIVTEQVAYNSFFGQYTTSGAGSGVILSEDGLIVTNYHVVEGASTVKVILHTGKELQATLEGGDAENDLALLRVSPNGENLTPALLGDSSSLTVGEGVVAIGNPLGQLGGTVTNGIVSALDREIEIDNVSMRLLQTNAAVNPGNSGGGLFNMYGELVGIVSAKSSASNTEGLGFAIPIDHAKDIIEELVSYGYVRGRIDLGMELVEILDANTAMYYNVTESGVYIYSIEDNSLGFRSGDLILSIDGTEILNMEQFDQVLDSHQVGDILSVTVKRRTGRDQYETPTYSLPLKEEVPTFIP